jgi:alkylation response protein AidB-like acyl-CoA dehydrogenase
VEFSLNDEQRDLQRTLRDFVERHASGKVVRDAAERSDGFSAPVWVRLTGEMELTGLAIDPRHGGTGASFVEVGIALEELGRSLVPVPFLVTVTAAHTLGGPGIDAERAAPLLERITGGCVAAVSLGENSVSSTGASGAVTLNGQLDHVLDGPHAAFLIAAVEDDDGPALYGIDLAADGVVVQAQATMDQTRRQATIRLTDAPATRLTAAGDAGAAEVERGREILYVALACEAVGAAARCLEITVEYLGERVQFGRPIGSFQALKHRCADLFVALESARSTAAYASWAVDGAPQELPTVAPLSQLVCGETLLQIASESIQLHGGIGFTWEHDAHYFFKRAKSTELLSGGNRHLRRLIGQRAGII